MLYVLYIILGIVALWMICMSVYMLTHKKCNNVCEDVNIVVDYNELPTKPEVNENLPEDADDAEKEVCEDGEFDATEINTERLNTSVGKKETKKKTDVKSVKKKTTKKSKKTN